MGRGKRYDDTPKLNMKKVLATIIAIGVLVMVIVSLKNLLTKKEKITKDVSTLTTYISIFDNGKWGVMDNKGNIVIPTTYEEMLIIPDSNKPIFICSYNVNYEDETFKTKVLNENGEQILSQYENINAFENTDGTEIWYENDILKYEKDGKYGLINFEGTEMLPAEYDNIYVLKGIHKSLIVEKNGKKGLVSSSTGEIIINPEYIEISSITNSHGDGYIVKNENNKCGVISLNKKNILEVKYDEVKKVTGGENYVVVENGKLEIVDSTGKVILDTGFDSVESINANQFVIIKDGKYGVISNEGKEIIPTQYEDLKYITKENYIAKKDGKYGVVSTDNTIKVEFTYESMSYVKAADFIQADNADYTTDIYNSNLEKILEQVIISNLNIEDGYLRVRKGNDYEYYNFKFEKKTNIEILATNTLFLFKQNGKYGYKNKNGEVIVDPIYDDAKEQNTFGYCSVKKDGLWGALKSDGTIVLKPSVNLDDYLYVDFIGTWHRVNDLNLNVYIK